MVEHEDKSYQSSTSIMFVSLFRVYTTTIRHLRVRLTNFELLFFFWWGGTYVTRYYGHFWPIVQPQMKDEGDCGAIGGMEIGRGNRSTRRKPSPAPFCPPQIPLDQTRARTRAAAVGSQRLTA
jgi:hypothetical protein